MNRRPVRDADGATVGTLYLPPETSADGVLVIASHGHSADHDFLEHERHRQDLELWLAQGWHAATHRQGGEASWGNAQALEGAREAYTAAAALTPVRRVVAFGFSMGGLASLNIAAHRVLPDLLGVVTVNGVVDTHTFTPEHGVWEAYGASSWDDLAERQSGSDPARDDPQRLAGIPILQLAGRADLSVEPARHTEVLAARAATPELLTTVLGAWGHVDGPFSPELIVAWIRARL